jgi:hypothetical protein
MNTCVKFGCNLPMGCLDMLWISDRQTDGQKKVTNRKTDRGFQPSGMEYIKAKQHFPGII